jgi:hypothetical protein
VDNHSGITASFNVLPDREELEIQIKAGRICLLDGCFSSSGCPMVVRESKGSGVRPICRVVEKVYASGWKICGEITVYSHASYKWKQTNVWQTAPSVLIHTRQVSSLIFTTLKTSVETSPRWEKVEGIPTTVKFIDDTKSKPVPGVEELVTLLHTQQFPMMQRLMPTIIKQRFN